MSKDYKTLKEDFVSNLTGSSLSDIGAVTFIVPVSVAVYSLLQSKHHIFTNYGPAEILIDFSLQICAILLATTIYAHTPLTLYAALIAPALVLWLLPPLNGPKSSKKAKIAKATKLPVPKNAKGKKTNAVTLASSESMDPLPIKPFLTTYRGAMMIITCLAILAVDFQIFPRKFAKVENWGTSLMDLGVGSFVFSAGVVGARPILKERVTGKHTTLGNRLYTSIRHALPLLVLGVIRLISVKGLEYAEHTAEYGVHWNFFFTLGFLPPFIAIFHSLFQLLPSFEILAVLLAGAYELVLNFTNLKKFILTAPRVDLFSQNREGIFSFIGYLAIFLAGQGTGTLVIPRSLLRSAPSGPSGSWAQRKKLLENLTYTSLAWCAGYVVCTEYYGLNLAVSRRLANLPYLMLVAAFNCLQLTAFCVVETVFFPEVWQASDKTTEKRVTKNATSRILSAYNRNGLAIFLAANLLTGLVNLTTDTLHASGQKAMGILVAYAAALTGLAVGLDVWDVSIKM